MSLSRWVGAVIVVLLVLVVVWWRRGDERTADEATTLPSDAGVVDRAPAHSTTPPRIPDRSALAAAGTAPVLTPPPVVRHSADPCTAILEPTLPDGFEVQRVDGITIAWSATGSTNPGPSEPPVRPLVLGHVVAGLLEEAGELTGTSPRSQLAIVVYPSRAEYLAATKAPEWSDGIYDGGAVRIPSRATGDLGVAMVALRHEVMHAQLHATVGCMPGWFDEGVAMYFAGSAPAHDWIKMLRDPGVLEMGLLEASSFESVEPDKVSQVYAQSLAMVLYILDHGGEPALRDAVQTVHYAGDTARKLWEKLYPRIGERAVFDVLAKKTLGVPLGPELDALLKGVICCYGLKSVSAFGCRSVAPRPGESYWTDESASPRASCFSRW